MRRQRLFVAELSRCAGRKDKRLVGQPPIGNSGRPFRFGGSGARAGQRLALAKDVKLLNSVSVGSPFS